MSRLRMFRRTPHRRCRTSLSLLVLALALAGTAAAAEFRSAELVEVAAGEVVAGDLYAAGQRVLIAGSVEGDLIAVGEEIVIEGTVEGDVIAAGRTVTLRGVVGDDARLSAAAIDLVGGVVGGDLIASGYSLRLDGDAAVDGDLAFGGRQALLAGRVGGRAWIGAEGLELSGTIGGDLQAAVAAAGGGSPPAAAFGLPPIPAVAAGLELTPAARIGGDLQLMLPEGATVPAAAETVAGGELRLERVAGSSGPPWWRVWFERALALALVGALLLALLPARLRSSAERVTTTPWRSLGLGALTLVGAPLALLLLLGLGVLIAALLAPLALGGLGGALLAVALLLALAAGLALALLIVFVAPVVAALAGGQALLTRSGRGSTGTALALLLGVALLTLLLQIPLAGALVALAAALFGLGALWPSRGDRSAELEGAAAP